MKRKNRKPSFFWQGVLILAPVLVLAKIGALAISQDRRIARHEAEVRAQEIADEAAQAIWTSLLDSNQPAGQAIPLILPELPDTNGLRRTSTNILTGTIKSLYVQYPVLLLTVDAAGQLVWPPPYEVTPSPEPFDTAELNDSQRALWATAQSESTTNAPLSQRAQSWKLFIDSDPPTKFKAAALFALGETRLEMGMNAEDCFRAIVERCSSAKTESGLPVRPLAVFKEFQARNAHGIEPRSYTDQYARTLAQLLAEPLAITPELLTQLIRTTNHPALPADVAREKEFQSAKAWYEWETHEQVRRIHSAASPFPAPPPAAFWVSLKKEAPMDFPPRYIESTPRPHSTMREPEPSPNAPTAVWSNAMAEEASERSRRILGNYYHYGVGRLIVDERWLLVHLTNGSPTTFFCRNGMMVADAVSATLKRIRKPEYMGITVRIAGADIISSNELETLEHVVSGKGGGQYWKRNRAAGPPPLLASATRYEPRPREALLVTVPSSALSFGGHNESGLPLLSVGVHLISPDLLFEQQQERATLFRLLIGASALASVVGFFAAWRAFRKQLRLAEMKSNFVSSVSHELRAPIASVRLMAEGLERGKISEPAKQREYFRFITQECRRLSSMIENVLDFARIEQGRKQYEFEPTDVRALVEQTVKLMEPYAAERGVRLMSNFECRVSNAENAAREGQSAAFPADASNVPMAQSNAPSPWGEGRGEGDRCVANLDGQAIQQALVNLIDNAIKHSPSGSDVLVELHATSGTDSRSTSHESRIALSVSDHGPGIPPAEHEKIFERFYRLGSELRRETPGVGIGLSIVKHIVEAHGGRVRVESDVGQGSRFTIELRLTTEAQRRETGEVGK